MKRIYLSLEESLFDRLESEAAEQQTTPSKLAAKIIAQRYSEIAVDPIVNEVIASAIKSFPPGKPFVLAEVPVFSQLGEAGEDARLVKARVARKVINSINNGQVCGVKRARAADGSLLFISRKAVFVVEEG